MIPGNYKEGAAVLLTAMLALGCGTKPSQMVQPSDKTVSAADGTVLQSAKDMHVYYVFDGKRHYVPNPSTLEALGFSKQVRLVPDSQASAIPLGEPIPALTSKVLVKAGTGQVFLIEGGKRRYIPDPDTMQAMHIPKEQIKYVPDASADVIPMGDPVPRQGSASSK